MKCEIVRDLLPSYIDGLTSSVTNEEIEKHLDECVMCRQFYREMREKNFGMPEGLPNQDGTYPVSGQRERDHRILRKFRRIRLKWIAITCAAVAVVISVLFWISSLWIKLPYEQVQVEAEIQEPEMDVIEFDDGTSQTMRSAGVRVEEKAGTYGFNYVDCRYRRMMIDGSEKAVTFVNCQMTVGDYIFRHEPVKSGTGAVYVQKSVDNKDFENTDMIFYLDKGIEQIENVSEDEALQLIDDYGTLLWEGGSTD